MVEMESIQSLGIWSGVLAPLSPYEGLGAAT